MREVQDFIAKVDIEGGRSMTEGPYKLPEGWRWVRLGEVCEVLQGKTPPKSAYVNRPTAIKVLKFRDITPEGHIVWDNTERGFLERDENWRYAKIGDVLVTASAHSPDQIGRKVALLDFIPSEYSRVAVTAELMVLRPLTISLDSLWLKYWLASADGYQQLQMQVKEKHLVQSRAINILLPLPPLEEQKRIVARIEELMERVREARRLREEAKQEAERLWQAVLAQTFPRPGSELPEGWRWVRLGEVAWRESVTLQPSARPDDVFYYIGMEHVAPGQWDEPTPVQLSGAEIKSQVIKYWPGLVLYGKLRPYLNKVVVPSREGVASTEFIPMAVNKDSLDPYYLGAYLRSPSFVAYASQNTTGSRQPRVRLDALWNALIPLPPLEEQRRIVAYLQEVQEKIKALKEAQAQTEAELKRLEQAILEKAFRGDL